MSWEISTVVFRTRWPRYPSHLIQSLRIVLSFYSRDGADTHTLSRASSFYDMHITQLYARIRPAEVNCSEISNGSPPVTIGS